MIIQKLDLKAFGRFTDVSLDLSAGPRRFHLIYGSNESGKSTSLRAITSLLFGMDHRTDDNYLHTNAQMRVGGTLSSHDGRTLSCIRRRGRKGTLRDANDKDVIDESLMATMLGGIDRETFTTRFGISHQELVDGGAAILAGEGNLGEILFAAGAGVSHLREIQAALDEGRDQLFMPRGSRAINQALKELEEKRKSLRQIQVQPTTFMDLRDHLQDKRTDAQRQAQEVERSTIELARLRAYEQALPLLPQWRSDIEQLASLVDTPRIDEAFSERRREADSQREIASELHASLTGRLAELNEVYASMPIDNDVIEHQAEIETLFQELATRDKADRDCVDLLRVRRNLDRKVNDLLRELSIDVSLTDDDSDALDDAVDRVRVNDAVRTRVHELSVQYERLAQQRDDADDRLKTLNRKIADVEERLVSVGSPPDPAALSLVLDEVGSPASLLESASEQGDACARLQQRSQDLLCRLSGFDGNCQRAVRLQIPEVSLVDRLSAEMQAADETIQSLKKQLAATGQQREQLNRRLVTQRKRDPLPTDVQLNDARGQRDAIIEQMRTAADPEHLMADLRERVAQADQIVDTIRLHHQEVHQRAADEAQLALTDQSIADLESQIEFAVTRHNSASEEWHSVWNACGVTAETPSRMRRWMNEHEKLVATVQQCEREETRYEQLQQRVHRVSSRLQSALDGVNASRAVSAASSLTQASLFDVTEPETESLDTLYDEAVALRSELSRNRLEYESLLRKRSEFHEELPGSQTRLETCQRAFDQWQADWQLLTESFANSSQSTPGVVVSMLTRIDELCAKKRERDILTSRIRSIGEDEADYGRRVSRLAGALTCANAGADKEIDVGATVKIIYARLQSERSAAAQRASIKQEIEQTNKRLTEASSKCDECKVVLRQLCKEAGVTSSGDLPSLERRSRERDQTEASLRDLENQLSLLASDEPLPEFVDAARERPPALLESQILQLEQSLSEQQQQLQLLQQEIGALQHEMDQLNGSRRASDLHQSIQHLIGGIGRDAEEYARLKIASMIMRRAIDHYRQENQSPVLDRAEAMFRDLTGAEYRTLKVDYNSKGKSILFGGQADGVDVPVSCMSTGTADSLYLALRLASLQHQLRHGESIPLVIDDCLIQLDDDRVVAALKILSELSESTQVILFTHHQHILDLAANHLSGGDYHIQRLG